MNEKNILKDKIIELEKLHTINGSEQMKILTGKRIQKLLNADPMAYIHLGDLENRISLQQKKLERLEQHNGPEATRETIKRTKESLEQEIKLLEEIITLYKKVVKN